MRKVFTKKEKQVLIGGTALGVGASMLGSDLGGDIVGLTGVGVGLSVLNRATKPLTKKKR